MLMSRQTLPANVNPLQPTVASDGTFQHGGTIAVDGTAP
jgi:hypothetical protein